MRRILLPLTALLACLCLATGSATATTVTPGLSVSTLFPPPGTKLTVTGMHFKASEMVTVKLGATSLGTAHTGPKGEFITTVTIPASEPPGNQTLSATQSPSGLSAHKTIDVRTNWAQEGFGPGHWNDNYYENVLNTGNVAHLTQAWASAGTSGANPSQAELLDYDGDVFGSCHDTAGLCAYAARTGTRLWSLSNHVGTVPVPPLVGANGMVVGASGYCYTSVGSCQYLTAINATTGKIVWAVRVPSSSEQDPLSVGSTIYLATDTDLQARARSTGKLLWSIPDPCNSPPTYYDHVLYLGADDGLQAISTVTHKPLWFRRPGFLFEAAPVVADGVVYGGVSYLFPPPGFAAYNAFTGAAIWVNTSITPVGAASYGDYGLIYVGINSGIAALSTTTGAVRWTAFAGNWFGNDAPPTVANGVVYASADGMYGTAGVFAMNAKTGAALWSNTLGGIAPDGSPVVANGWVYVTDANDSIHAFDQ